MNAGGVSKACKSRDPFGGTGRRESNTLVTYLILENNPEKFGLILDGLRSHKCCGVKLRRYERDLWPISLLVR